MANRFHYFSYGSNLLASRIHVMNKTATALGMGRLCNYKLVFSGWSDNWKGSPANIVPEENSSVLGMIWTLDNSDVVSLDKQEAGYRPIEVQVTPEGSNASIICRTYVQLPEIEAVNPNGTPSLAYKNIILKGAEENNFPSEYIQALKERPDNGRLDCGLARLLDD